jgi:hypothetical protein
MEMPIDYCAAQSKAELLEFFGQHIILRYVSAFSDLHEAASAVECAAFELQRARKHSKDRFAGCISWTAWPWLGFVPAPEAERLVELLVEDYHKVVAKEEAKNGELGAATSKKENLERLIKNMPIEIFRGHNKIQEELDRRLLEIQTNHRTLSDTFRAQKKEVKAKERAKAVALRASRDKEERRESMEAFFRMVNDREASQGTYHPLEEYLIWEFRHLLRQTKFSPERHERRCREAFKDRRKAQRRRQKRNQKHVQERRKMEERLLRTFCRMQLQQAAIERTDVWLWQQHQQREENIWQRMKVALAEQEALRLQHEEDERQERTRREETIRQASQQEEAEAEEFMKAEESEVLGAAMKIHDDLAGLHGLATRWSEITQWLASREEALADKRSLTATTFPRPPSVECEHEACESATSGALTACPCNLRNLFRLCFGSEAELKRERNRWHPDKFRLCNDPVVETCARELFEAGNEVCNEQPRPGITFGEGRLQEYEKIREGYRIAIANIAKQERDEREKMEWERRETESRMEEMVEAFRIWGSEKRPVPHDV